MVYKLVSYFFCAARDLDKDLVKSEGCAVFCSCISGGSILLSRLSCYAGSAAVYFAWTQARTMVFKLVFKEAEYHKEALACVNRRRFHTAFRVGETVVDSETSPVSTQCSCINISH